MSLQSFALPRPVTCPLAKILYVEDQPAVAAIILLELVRARLDVTVVRTGEQCLAVAREQPFDLILLDHMLPGLDGLEVCRRLKRDNVLKRIPVVFFTAAPNIALAREARRLGAEDYLEKSFHSSELTARILAAITLAQATTPPLRIPAETGRDLVSAGPRGPREEF